MEEKHPYQEDAAMSRIVSSVLFSLVSYFKIGGSTRTKPLFLSLPLEVSKSLTWFLRTISLVRSILNLFLSLHEHRSKQIRKRQSSLIARRGEKIGDGNHRFSSFSFFSLCPVDPAFVAAPDYQQLALLNKAPTIKSLVIIYLPFLSLC